MEEQEYKKMDALETEHWWFKAKRQFLAIVLDSQPPTGRPLKVLDVGCGTGAVMNFLRARGYDTHGVDMSETALAYCRQKGLQVARSTADHIDFPDATFDIVFALDVLEHIDNAAEAVIEIKRILRPGGLLIATVPAHQFLFSYHDVALHHKRRYNKKTLRALLSPHLTIERLSWIHAAILLPAIALRAVKKLVPGKNTLSDVGESSPLVNRVMGMWYVAERAVFKMCGHLPWGLSLLVVGRKKNE